MLETDIMSGMCPGWGVGEDVACMSVKAVQKKNTVSSDLIPCWAISLLSVHEAWLSQYASVGKSYYTEILKTQGFILFFLGHYVQCQTEIKWKAKTTSKVLILGDLLGLDGARVSMCHSL